MCLTKRELNRIRHVNEMKRIANKSVDLKLCYYPGGNLVLLERKGFKWVVQDQTGPWRDEEHDDQWLQWKLLKVFQSVNITASLIDFVMGVNFARRKGAKRTCASLMKFWKKCKGKEPSQGWTMVRTLITILSLASAVAWFLWSQLHWHYLEQRNAELLFRLSSVTSLCIERGKEHEEFIAERKRLK